MAEVRPSRQHGISGTVTRRMDAAATFSPVIFGRLMDRGMSSAVLCGVAFFQVVAVLFAFRVGQARVESAAAAR